MENSSSTDFWGPSVVVRPAISSVDYDYKASLFQNPLSPFTTGVLLSLGIFVLATKSKTWFNTAPSSALRTHESPRWYPHKDPILGLDVLYDLAMAVFNHRFLEFTAELISRYGGTITYLTLGRQAIYTIDPVNVHAMLTDRTRYQDFGVGSRKQSLKPLLGSGIFTSDGAIWKHHRSMIRPFLSRVQTAEVDVFEIHLQTLFQTLPADGSTVDLQRAFNAMTLDISTHLFLGTSTNVLSSLFHPTSDPSHTRGQQFAAAFDYAQRAISGIDDFGLSGLLWKLVFGDKKLDQSVETVHSFIDDIIEQQLGLSKLNSNSSNKGQNFFSDLLKQGRSKEDIKYDVLNLLLAGKDSNASFLTSVWYVLSQRPDLCAKIREEINTILHGNPATLEDLSKFTYLTMVLQEVLRLYPPVAVNQRTAEVDTVLPHGGGADGESPLRVPRGASVGYSVYAMHRLPEYFGDDVDEFRPERWLDIKPKAAYMPFHAGPRTCLGQHLSMCLAKYSTIRILQHYARVENRNVEPWQEKLGLNCSSRHGALVGLTVSSSLEA